MTQAMIGGSKSTIMCHDMVMIFIFLPLMVETRTTGPGSIKRYTSDKGNDCFAIASFPGKNFRLLAGHGWCFASGNAHNDWSKGRHFSRDFQFSLPFRCIQRRDRETDRASTKPIRTGGKHQVFRRQPAIGDDEWPQWFSANNDQRSGVIEGIEFRGCEAVMRMASSGRMNGISSTDQKCFHVIRQAIQGIFVLNDGKRPRLLMHGCGSVDGGIEQRADDGLVDFLGRIITHG